MYNCHQILVKLIRMINFTKEVKKMCIGLECKICEEFYGIWYMKGNGDSSVPVAYELYKSVMSELRILSLTKNDALLIEYLENNENLYRMNFCYLAIAYYIVDDVISKSNKLNGLNYRKIVEFVVDYLYYSFGWAYEGNNELKKKYNCLRKDEIKEKYRFSFIRLRKNQTKYRKELININKSCQLCGLENEQLLTASHIKTYSKSNVNEYIHFENGLLLCKNHDALFDKGLISFTNEGDILISSNLSQGDIEKLNILEKKIILNEEQKKYMKWHRINEFKK